MGIDRLEQPQDDPNGQCEQMQITGQVRVDNREANCAGTETDNFSWVGIFCGETKWSCISMMLLVDVLVERAVMEEPVCPVVPHIFKDKEDCPLFQHCRQWWEGDRDTNAKRLAEGVERPDGKHLH